MAQQSDPTVPQVTMTLAALAATGATPRPSGETLAQQSARIFQGIKTQLANPQLATGGTWQPVWLALSPDNANMAYIARNTDGSNEFAVVTRGTTASLTDILEDLDVGTVVPFHVNPSANPVAVSKGAMEAFTQIANAPSLIPVEDMQGVGARGPEAVIPPLGGTVRDALAMLLQSVPPSPPPTVYVTGHSLGGCLATMIAPYLWTEIPQAKFALITYAAPTAGLQSFVDYLNTFPWLMNERHVNAYDLVPLAWDDLAAAKNWYPSPGPAATDEVKLLLDVAGGRTKGNAYVQPGVTSPTNPNYTVLAKNLVNKTTADFFGQVGFQHANSTYLSLLGAPEITADPVVTGVSPTFGESRTTVIISGSGFTSDTVVDFGPIPVPVSDFVINSDTQITATAPLGTGIVDVRVTNMFGTSPAVPLGQFAYNGPAPVVVSAVSPTSGKARTQVMITGSGFGSDATVYFNKTAAASVTVHSPSQITATAPVLVDDSQTVDVTVKVGLATSVTSPADEFTYTGL
ncbi:IPT/TIG domain-containing protein [Streptomyces sp. NPDC002671]